jgi:hypothetical protein
MLTMHVTSQRVYDCAVHSAQLVLMNAMIMLIQHVTHMALSTLLSWCSYFDSTASRVPQMRTTDPVSTVTRVRRRPICNNKRIKAVCYL